MTKDTSLGSTITGPCPTVHASKTTSANDSRVPPYYRIDPLLRVYGNGKPISHDFPNISELLDLPRCPRSPYEASMIEARKIKAKIEATRKKESLAKADQLEIEAAECEEKQLQLLQVRRDEEMRKEELVLFEREVAELKTAQEVVWGLKFPKGGQWSVQAKVKRSKSVKKSE